MWKFVQRVLPDSYDQLKELVNSHYGDLPVLYEEVVHAMAESLPLQQYREVLANAVEQGGLTLTPFGRTGFSVPDTQFTQDSKPVTWRVVDLNISLGGSGD